GWDDAWSRSLSYATPLSDYSATVRLLVNVWLRLHGCYLGGDRLVRHGELNPESTAFAIQIALFERFAAAARAVGARPVIVVFPDQESVVAARHGQRTVVGPLIASLAARRLEYVDLTAAFLNPELAGSVGDWFASGGHYSPAGNRIVAQWLGRELLARMAARHTDGAAAQDAPTPVLVRACPGGTVRQRGVAAAGVAPRGFASFGMAGPLWIKEKLFTDRDIRSALGGYEGDLLYCEHHESHAASAFFPSPFEEAAILTVDGVGEWATAACGVGRGADIELLSELHWP